MCPYPAHDSNVNDDGDVNDTDADNGESDASKLGQGAILWSLPTNSPKCCAMHAVREGDEGEIIIIISDRIVLNA